MASSLRSGTGRRGFASVHLYHVASGTPTVPASRCSRPNGGRERVVDVEDRLLAPLSLSCRPDQRERRRAAPPPVSLSAFRPLDGRPTLSDQTTLGQATRTANQVEREPRSQMARNIRLPVSTLEDRGHA